MRGQCQLLSAKLHYDVIIASTSFALYGLVFSQSIATIVLGMLLQTGRNGHYKQVVSKANAYFL